MPLARQLKEAIEHTQTEQLQQQKRIEVARAPRSLHATITVEDAGRAERIQVALEEARASVWQVNTMVDERT